MAKKGMSPDAVNQMADKIDELADNIKQKYQEVQGRVEDLDWTGEDRDKFISEFESTVGQAFDDAAQKLGDLSERARTNASQQTDASGS